MAETIHIAIPADLAPLMRQLADDARSWATRLAHDAGGQQDALSQQIARDARTREADTSRIVRAIDAALAQAPTRVAA